MFFCNACAGVQLVDAVDPTLLFAHYFYFSSAIRTLREHFVDYSSEVTARFIDPPHATVVEIGCNDGVLLRPLADQRIRTVIGVDPATNIVNCIDDPRITVVNDYFSESLARDMRERYGPADLVIANNVYAHIPDIRGVTRGIAHLLSDEGVFVLEVHYLGRIIQGLQYDMIYHEHLYYYSLLALINHLARYDMVVFDVKPIPIHGGSMRYYVCKRGSRHADHVSPRVGLLQKEELAGGLDRAETFRRFASNIAERRDVLMGLLDRIRRIGRRVVGYGASGRANTIIQYCNITAAHLEYIIDDAPAKHGFYTPGSHFEIRPNTVLQENPPDYLLLFAWGYFNEIAEKCRSYLDGGGRMIVPLPDVRLILHATPATPL
jgi:SAM-dependent methyltransferase